jgi:hypothetical protein
MTDKDASGSLPARLYSDTVSPAAREVGGTLAATVRLALSPANLVIRTLQEVLDFAEASIKARFERWKTDPGTVVPPPPEIAAPVLQALRFANQDQALREMYLTLLARSMDARQVSGTHPAFADILRTLSPDEARLLPILAAHDRAIPLIEVRIPVPPGWHTVLKHVSPLGGLLSPPGIVRRQAIDNLVRTGVLAVHDMFHMSNEDTYRRLEGTPEVKEAVAAIAAQGRSHTFHRYMAEITDFGATFLEAVVDSDAA